ncbi:MAG: hypothetical protein HEP71_30360 [Roseivirga sp.]|nr:hypothetical protein [Roseivirga sp.]
MQAPQKKRLCFIGIMMVITGSVSFSNYPLVGDILVVSGAILIIVKEILWRRSRVS